MNYNSIKKKYIKETLLLRKEYKKTTWITVNGISMLPIIPDESKVKVVSTKHYNIGDIIVFIYNNLIYIHRIVYIKVEMGNKYFITKGDNAISLDNRIEKNQIIGKILKVKTNKFQKKLETNPLSTLVSIISYISGKSFNYYKTTNSSLLAKIFKLINKITKKINNIILFITLLPTFYKNK